MTSESTSALISLIKDAMGYIEEVPTCESCRHRDEIPSKYVDRDWIQICTFPNVTEFQVEMTGSCTKHQEKESTET